MIWTPPTVLYFFTNALTIDNFLVVVYLYLFCTIDLHLFDISVCFDCLLSLFHVAYCLTLLYVCMTARRLKKTERQTPYNVGTTETLTNQQAAQVFPRLCHFIPPLTLTCLQLSHLTNEDLRQPPAGRLCITSGWCRGGLQPSHLVQSNGTLTCMEREHVPVMSCNNNEIKPLTDLQLSSYSSCFMI